MDLHGEEAARVGREAMQDAPHDGQKYGQARAAICAVLELLAANDTKLEATS